MFNIALYQPKIAPNTGNIIRLCANTGAQLHLIHPLGFVWSDKKLHRAGLDYHELACIQHHADAHDFLAHAHPRLIMFSTRGRQRYDTLSYQAGDTLIFGSETAGLPSTWLNRPDSHCVYLPMQAKSRCLNLANSVAIALYTAWGQHDFAQAIAPERPS